MVGADSSIVGSSQYPVAVDPKKVGTYPAETKSGAGYFYDDVLEYRVWFHPEQGAQKLNGDADYYEAFAQYERAEEVSMARQGAEPPLVLIRQREWINEPEPGHYIPEKGDRLTEWQVEWLTGSHRTGESIREFLKHPRQSQLAEPPRQ
jgi:putative acetyltransferase